MSWSPLSTYRYPRWEVSLRAVLPISVTKIISSVASTPTARSCSAGGSLALRCGRRPLPVVWSPCGIQRSVRWGSSCAIRIFSSITPRAWALPAPSCSAAVPGWCARCGRRGAFPARGGRWYWASCWSCPASRPLCGWPAFRLLRAERGTLGCQLVFKLFGASHVVDLCSLLEGLVIAGEMFQSFA